MFPWKNPGTMCPGKIKTKTKTKVQLVQYQRKLNPKSKRTKGRQQTSLTSHFPQFQLNRATTLYFYHVGERLNTHLSSFCNHRRHVLRV